MDDATTRSKNAAMNAVSGLMRQRSMPQEPLAILLMHIRERDERDLDGVKRDDAVLRVLERFGNKAEVAAGGLPAVKAGLLRDRDTQRISRETILNLIASIDGIAGFEAAGEAVGAVSSAQLKEIDAERRTEEQRAAAQHAAKLADEVALMDPSTELNRIAASGVRLAIAADGTISASPARRLSMPHRRMIEAKRDQVARLLEQQQTAEVL
jgi:hypothetical protein